MWCKVDVLQCRRGYCNTKAASVGNEVGWRKYHSIQASFPTRDVGKVDDSLHLCQHCCKFALCEQPFVNCLPRAALHYSNKPFVYATLPRCAFRRESPLHLPTGEVLLQRLVFQDLAPPDVKGGGSQPKLRCVRAVPAPLAGRNSLCSRQLE